MFTHQNSNKIFTDLGKIIFSFILKHTQTPPHIYIQTHTHTEIDKRKREREFKTILNTTLFPNFSCMKFSILECILRSFNHVELSYMQGDKYYSICILLHAAIQYDYFLKMLSFFPVCFSGLFIKIRLP